MGALLLLLALAQVRQPFPSVAPLHHLPTLTMVLAAPFLLRRWPLSNASVACLAAFLALHTIGGRYTYWAVPYDAWSDALFGASISEAFGFTRNHYDRMVHFAYGLLVVRPLSELMMRHAGTARRAAPWLALAILTSFSALYEMFEWLLTLFVAGATANDYNGQQGDAWDAQKDMALALGGVLAGTAIMRLGGRRTSEWQNG